MPGYYFTGSNFNFKTCIVNRSLCQLAQQEKNLNLGPIFRTFFRCLICVQLLNSKILDRKVPNILRTRLKFEGRLKYSFLGIYINNITIPRKRQNVWDGHWRG